MNYFSLAPHVYASRFPDSIIILDSQSDNYISLIDPASHYLQQILELEFSFDAQKKIYASPLVSDNDQLTYWISFFSEQQFIVRSAIPNNRPIAPMPARPGGLADYQWDSKTSWQSFTHISWQELCSAVITLAAIHWRMKRKGIKGVLQTIPVYQQSILYEPTAQEIQHLADVVDCATRYYPNKTFCLAWAATFVTLARKKGWDSTLAIGVQAQPFYAHAWAEIKGTVVHDDPIIAQVLSIIMKTP